MRDVPLPASCSRQASATASISSATARLTCTHRGKTGRAESAKPCTPPASTWPVLLDCAWEPEAAYDVVAAALEVGLQPSALICMNDRAAFGTYQALNEAGLRIPDDVSVLAFEGSELATWLKPKLTTIDRGLHKMGWRAIDRLTGADPPLGMEYQPMTLRSRESTIAPRQKIPLRSTDLIG